MCASPGGRPRFSRVSRARNETPRERERDLCRASVCVAGRAVLFYARVCDGAVTPADLLAVSSARAARTRGVRVVAVRRHSDTKRQRRDTFAPRCTADRCDVHKLARDSLGRARGVRSSRGFARKAQSAREGDVARRALCAVERLSLSLSLRDALRVSPDARLWARACALPRERPLQQIARGSLALESARTYTPRPATSLSLSWVVTRARHTQGARARARALSLSRSLSKSSSLSSVWTCLFSGKSLGPFVSGRSLRADLRGAVLAFGATALTSLGRRRGPLAPRSKQPVLSRHIVPVDSSLSFQRTYSQRAIVRSQAPSFKAPSRMFVPRPAFCKKCETLLRARKRRATRLAPTRFFVCLKAAAFENLVSLSLHKF